MSERRRMIMAKEEIGMVDLGLPSGRLWAKGNITSDGNGGYAIGEETDYGAYFSWGNIVPHFSSNGSSFADGYNFSESNYNNTPGSSISAIPSNDSIHDAARALIGHFCHLPTLDDFIELNNNTNKSFVTINGVSGVKFAKKTDSSVYVFFNMPGFGENALLEDRGRAGYFATSTLYDYTRLYALEVLASSIDVYHGSRRYCGISIRPVI